MSNDRDQGPHYIPELDPERPESGPQSKQRILWAMFIVGTLLALLGAGLYVGGMQTPGLAIGLVGLIMLGLLMPLGLG